MLFCPHIPQPSLSSIHPLDFPLLHPLIFHTKKAQRNSSTVSDTFDGTIPVIGAELGYRLYRHADPCAPLLLFWHGNRATVANYDLLAPHFRQAGVSLLVLDYRGYGWSTGKPGGSTLLPDAEAVLSNLPLLLERHGLAPDVPLYSAGRSLGSAPAIHLAYRFPRRFCGLLVESAFAHAPDVLGYFRLPRRWLDALPDPLGNPDKIASVYLPTLIVHGETDRLIHITHGETLYARSAARWKRLVRVPEIGHTQLMHKAPALYTHALRALLQA